MIGDLYKRRSNLIFYCGADSKISDKRVGVMFQETIKNLEWNHVEAGFSTALEEIRSEDAMQI